MYVVNMNITKVYAQGEYTFKTKKDCQNFLEKLNNYELENIKSIEKYNKKSWRNVFDEFFC